MTIVDIAALANKVRGPYDNAAHFVDDSMTLAGAVRIALDRSPSLPCGHTVAGARDGDGPYVEIDGDTMSPEAARGLAVAILKAADIAEADDSAREKESGE
jgi:hypothetical protein